MNKITKNIPNILTISRIIVSPLIIILWNHKVLNTIVIFYCVLTDIIDGYLARKLKIATKWGGKLDSLADVFFYLSLVVLILIYEPKILINYILLIGILITRITSVIICKVRNHEIYSIHTIGNKMTGVIVILGVFLYWVLNMKMITTVVFSLATLSAIEELLIFLIIRNPDINMKSLLNND
jgi:CDP-diacylglycerol--glycerol-3-phosphate 3-phosphatidyltransferase